MITYLIIAVLGYLLGSFPTAYLALKYFKNVNITEAGSGNVGTLNSLRVSNSKPIALLVLIVDFTKGFLSVIITWELLGESFIFGGIALLFAILGHCFSPWINFKGGRGLATAGGGGVILSLPIIILWAIFWIVTYLFRKHIHLATVLASLCTGILSFTSAEYFNKSSRIPAEHLTIFSVIVIAILLIIVVKHVPSLVGYFNEQSKKNRKDRYERN